MLKLGAVLLSLIALGLGGGASAVTITFEGLEHGRIVASQFEGDGMKVSILATNVGGGPGLAVAFDSNLGFGNSRDDDLQFEGQWATGNLKDVELGNLLIIQENGVGCGDGVCDRPDDEGSRPAGSFVFEFEMPIISFGLDMVDVEDTMAEGGSITFYDQTQQGFETVTIPMMSPLFLDAAGISLGDRSANRVEPFLLAGLQLLNPFLVEIDRVDVNMGGSGGIDNVTYEFVPEPSTVGLLGFGLAALAGVRRRR